MDYVVKRLTDYVNVPLIYAYEMLLESGLSGAVLIYLSINPTNFIQMNPNFKNSSRKEIFTWKLNFYLN